MDEHKTDPTEEEKSTKEEIIIDKEEKVSDDAGPSGANVFLPGAVQSPKPKPQTPRSGLSKSEHNLRVFTTRDVADALKSLSFGAPNQDITNVNITLKPPVLDKQLINKSPTDSFTLLDLKKYVASCFKAKEYPVILHEIPLQTVQALPATTVIPNDLAELPNASCNTGTECAPVSNLPNEVIVTSPIEPKLSKGERKKTSGNLSDKSDLPATQRDSLSSIGSNVCRICMTRGRERLISPCNCKGSLANVHLSCLERWLNQVGRNHCELCGYSYPAIRTPRYTVLQALRLWFGNPRNRSHLQSDCLIFWLLSTVTAGLLAVCIVGTQYFVIEGNKFGKIDAVARNVEGISHRITETAMDFFMAIVLCGYSVTVYLLWKDHYVMWNRWRRANVNVRLLLAPDTNPVPFAPRPGYQIV